MNIFTSKHPIVAVAMNKASNLRLALACQAAGIVPSISFFNYYTAPYSYDCDRFSDDIETFITKTNSRDVIVSMGARNLFDTKIQEILSKFNIRYIELVDDVNEYTSEKITLIKNRLNLKLILKELSATPSMDCDAVVLKGPEGGGRSLPNSTSLVKLVETLRSTHPTICIVASGGIGTKEQIDELINAGANYAGIGTLFAAAEESPLSLDTKQRIVDATKDSLTRIGKLNQQALLFKNLNGPDDENNTRSLRIGINNPEMGGHVFLGSAVNEINEITTVEQIVNRLIGNKNGV